MVFRDMNGMSGFARHRWAPSFPETRLLWAAAGRKQALRQAKCRSGARTVVVIEESATQLCLHFVGERLAIALGLAWDTCR